MDAISKRSTPWIFWILLVSVVIVLGQSMYENSIAKNYLFYVEAECNPAISQCYVRSCDNNGDCPPNNLSTYSLYTIPAGLFSSCTDNSCSNICTWGNATCKEIPCSSQTDIECSEPPSSQELFL
mgnify:CR=1 FL=1